MLFLGVLIFILVTLVPGLLAVRLLRCRNLNAFDALLYAVGFGLVFNLVSGLVANFTFGISLIPVVVVYAVLLAALGILSLKFGKRLPFNWKYNWKSTAVLIPAGLYLLAVGLQLQTTLMSPNLIGSDIHLEYFCANLVLGQGFWDPMWEGSTINACLGITVLIPVYSLLTRMEIMWVFKLICPLVFAVLPLVLYRIFKMQFSTMVAVLAVVFFVTMPMFTLDMLQAVRQQHSELFFVLVVLLLLDGNMSGLRKIILGVIFGLGAITTHYGFAVGYVSYLLIGSVVVVILARLWRKKHELEDAKNPMLSRLVLTGLAIIALVSHFGYYSWVNNGSLIGLSRIPVQVIETTVEQASTSIVDIVKETPSADTSLGRFPFLNPLLKEPLLQTAIALDFARASMLGKIWRVLQYLVEICLIVGLLKLLFQPSKKIKLEYVAFVVTSFFALAGIYLLSTTSFGMGITRIWQVTLLFMSPLFVIGAGALGKWIARLKKNRIFNEGKLVAFSTLLLFIPYLAFNSGIVFELSKSPSVGFVDIPYSIALSGHRVDIASVFDEEDVEAMDWLKEYMVQTGDDRMVYSDAHGCNLIVQRIGYNLKKFQLLKFMSDESVGYVFLRKWNVENSMVTYFGEYGCRQSFSIDSQGTLEKVEGDAAIFNGQGTLKNKIEGGTVIFDNGARVISLTR